ncbi:MAG: hypothetical protein ACREP8_06065 [Candidatus Binatia bacterium]
MVRTSGAGESRICPHCKATILKSAPSCPLCHHVLRFVAVGDGSPSQPTECPLLVEGTIQHPGNGDAMEYSVLMEVHDEAGKVISRSTVGVGALQRAEKRTFSLRVEISPAAPVS